MQRSPWLWVGVGVVLAFGGVSLAIGSLVWFVSLLAIDPEDEVPILWYAVPLGLGGAIWGTLLIVVYASWIRRLLRRLRAPTTSLDAA